MSLFDYDAELRRYQEHLRAAVALAPTDHVLDIGCGAGLTTREAAAVAASAVGVDISAQMLARASHLAEREGLRNISFVQADAQTHPFPAGYFDLVVSRFGTMFFADPVAAFTNIGRALRPGGRLVALVWQSGDRQEWSVTIHGAFDASPPLSAPAFSLSDPDTVESVLTAAGFTGVTVTGVREPVYYGPDPASALDAALALKMTQDLLASRDSTGRARALGRLRDIFPTHQTPEGVAFDSNAWLVTAHR